jgi:hypothetical protein
MPALMKPKGSLSCSQEPVTAPDAVQEESKQHSTTLYVKDQF